MNLLIFLFPELKPENFEIPFNLSPTGMAAKWHRVKNFEEVTKEIEEFSGPKCLILGDNTDKIDDDQELHYATMLCDDGKYYADHQDKKEILRICEIITEDFRLRLAQEITIVSKYVPLLIDFQKRLSKQTMAKTKVMVLP